MKFIPSKSWDLSYPFSDELCRWFWHGYDDLRANILLLWNGRSCWGKSFKNWINHSVIYYGSLAKNQENGLDNLLCELDWHYLPNDLQKNVMQLMQRTQNGVKLTVGPFETINREHCKVVSTSQRVYALLSALKNQRFHFCSTRSPKRSTLLLCSCDDSMHNLDETFKFQSESSRRENFETNSVRVFGSIGNFIKYVDMNECEFIINVVFVEQNDISFFCLILSTSKCLVQDSV